MQKKTCSHLDKLFRRIYLHSSEDIFATIRAKTEFVSNLAGAIHTDKLLADEDGSTEEYSSTDDSSISEEEKETLKDGSIRHRCPFTKC